MKDPAKIIALVLTGTALVSGAVASGYKAVDSAKEYTDQNIKSLRSDQWQQMEKVQGDITDLKKDTAVIRIILEERFKKPK